MTTLGQADLDGLFAGYIGGPQVDRRLGSVITATDAAVACLG